jgi:hypothetical protein
MNWNVFHRHRALSDCHSFDNRELAVRYACALLHDEKEARGSAPGIGKRIPGGHNIRLIRAELT